MFGDVNNLIKFPKKYFSTSLKDKHHTITMSVFMFVILNWFLKILSKSVVIVAIKL